MDVLEKPDLAPEESEEQKTEAVEPETLAAKDTSEATETPLVRSLLCLVFSKLMVIL